jgi:putative nucleotidyltransferase with HDIG domain
MMQTSLAYAAYALFASLAAASIPVRGSPRLALVGAGLWCGVIQAAATIALGLIQGHLIVFQDSIAEASAAMLSGLLSALLVALVIPAVEVLLGYTTSFKLWDLASLNHPLLRELLVQAPGTYHHSIVVGALAEAGASSVGADPLLARVGGYYHDVGKIKSPRTFDENNRGSYGAAAPAEEAAQIKMHVADGLELGAKHRLGDPVLEIIAQHHGISSVRSLKKRAIELLGGPLSASDAAQFSYAGPKPLTREAALVMLADCVEAATQELMTDVPLEEGALESTVRRVTEELIAEGQLDATNLTLNEMRIAGDAMATALREMLMRRSRPSVSQLPTAAPRLVRPPPIDRPN